MGAAMSMPSREPSGYQGDSHGGGGGQAVATTQAVAQLFARLSQEIEEQKPKNCIHFVVDFLCKHYPEHLHGFASIWQMDPDLERERHEVVNFFKAHKISTAVAAHFTNAGYDTLDTLTTLNKESLVDVEAFNNVKWLPGHKVRLQQIFGEIAARVRAYRQQYGNPTANKKAGAASHHHAHDQHHHRSPSPTGREQHSGYPDRPRLAIGNGSPSYFPPHHGASHPPPYHSNIGAPHNVGAPHHVGGPHQMGQPVQIGGGIHGGFGAGAPQGFGGGPGLFGGGGGGFAALPAPNPMPNVFRPMA